MTNNNQPPSLREVISIWWPLSISWFLMALELPALSAVVARMAEPKINLAAYGGIVFPLALIIEAPIIMLLAASTALSKDWISYLKIKKFMHVLSGSLTLLHLLIATTPLYYFVVERIIGAPEEIIQPARLGLLIMLPWTWSVAYRRFNQGVLIRYNHTRTIGTGTLIRLSVDILVLLAGYFSQSITGIATATAAVSAGVISEAAFIGIKVRPVLREQLKEETKITPELTRSGFLSFYIPLALTSLITLLVQPLVSATLSRMPLPLESLAVWPVISGLLFMIRSFGVAYNEVVVALLDRPGAYFALKKFTGYLVLLTTFLLLAVAFSPFSQFWFQRVTALPESLIPLATGALWLGIFVPGANSLQSWFQGIMVYTQRTRGIPEAVAVFLFVSLGVYLHGIISANTAGIYIGVLGFSCGMVAQALWLWYRSRQAVRFLKHQGRG